MRGLLLYVFLFFFLPSSVQSLLTAELVVLTYYLQFARRHLNEGIVNRKSKSFFDFKYIPQVGKSTSRERFTKDGEQKRDWTQLHVPILASVANMVDIGAFEMVCLTFTAIVGLVAFWGLLLLGKSVPEMYTAFIAPHSSVSAIA